MIEEFKFDGNKTGLIISLRKPGAGSKEEQEHSIEELRLLAKTLGVEIQDIITQTRNKIEPNYFIGKGKVEEIKEYLAENKVDTVLFDNELSGIQERNLEKVLDVPIFGRTEVILNIFNKHARSNEARLQVKLASLEYMLPRLKNLWTHFSRVEGGIGIRGGEGEKQLELDRRMIQAQIDRIRKKLKKVDMQMKTRRKKRADKNLISLVGYTNAGKTSLLNVLAKTRQYAEDMLFATLDSNIKKVYINSELTVLLHDTVGFINKLPHNLVASFKSTLDEIRNSKLILHVLDISSPNIRTHIEAVNKVISEIGAEDIPVIRVFNKIDLLDENDISFHDINTNDILVSAVRKEGIDRLKEKINDFFLPD